MAGGIGGPHKAGGWSHEGDVLHHPSELVGVAETV